MQENARFLKRCMHMKKNSELVILSVCLTRNHIASSVVHRCAPYKVAMNKYSKLASEHSNVTYQTPSTVNHT